MKKGGKEVHTADVPIYNMTLTVAAGSDAGGNGKGGKGKGKGKLSFGSSKM